MVNIKREKKIERDERVIRVVGVVWERKEGRWIAFRSKREQRKIRTPLELEGGEDHSLFLELQLQELRPRLLRDCRLL